MMITLIKAIILMILNVYEYFEANYYDYEYVIPFLTVVWALADMIMLLQLLLLIMMVMMIMMMVMMMIMIKIMAMMMLMMMITGSDFCRRVGEC